MGYYQVIPGLNVRLRSEKETTLKNRNICCQENYMVCPSRVNLNTRHLFSFYIMFGHLKLLYVSSDIIFPNNLHS